MKLSCDYEISLDLVRNNYVTIRAKQFDDRTRKVKIHCTMEGQEFKLSEKYHPHVQLKKPDGTVVINPCEMNVADNVLIVDITKQMLAVAGEAEAEIVLFENENDEILSTMHFSIIIISILIQREDYISENDFLSLIDVMIKAEDLIDDMKRLEQDIVNHVEQLEAELRAYVSALEDELRAAEALRVAAENARAEAEKIRVENENIRIEAENARANAELERQKYITNLKIEVDNGRFDGATILHGPGVPSPDLGKDKDVYINMLPSGDYPNYFFTKADGVWTPQFQLNGSFGLEGLLKFRRYQETIYPTQDGQTDFTLTKGVYTVGGDCIDICVNGIIQPHSAIQETSETTFKIVAPMTITTETQIDVIYMDVGAVSNIATPQDIQKVKEELKNMIVIDRGDGQKEEVKVVFEVTPDGYIVVKNGDETTVFYPKTVAKAVETTSGSNVQSELDAINQVIGDLGVFEGACTLITDWNNTISNGYYMGDNAVNGPTQDKYIGYVLRSDEKHCVQRVNAYTTTREWYERWETNDVWSEWATATVKEINWDSITGKPGTFPATAHTHDDRYVPYTGASVAGQFDKSATAPTDSSTRLNYNGLFYATRIYGAVYNDYAEFRDSVEIFEAGRVVSINEDGEFELSSTRLHPVSRVVSDTYGMGIGRNKEVEHQVPIAVSGRALVYLDCKITNKLIGKPVCSGENGTASIMTRKEVKEHPECIIGVISSIPKEEYWGNDGIETLNKVWIEVR